MLVARARMCALGHKRTWAYSVVYDNCTIAIDYDVSVTRANQQVCEAARTQMEQAHENAHFLCQYLDHNPQNDDPFAGAP